MVQVVIGTPYNSSKANLVYMIMEILINTMKKELILFFFFCLFKAAPRHMEVPRLGVESELYLLAYTTATATQDPSHVCNLHHHSSQQHWILNPLSEARDRTDSSWILAGFINH